MKKIVLIAGTLAVMMLSSCSKTIILTDGQNIKKIRVAYTIESKKDEDNNSILTFESLLGTKYSINTSKYTYVIK